MKKIVFGFLIFSSFGFSQEVAAELKLKLTGRREIFQIVDEPKKEVSVFISDMTNVFAYKFNSEFKIIDSLKTALPNQKFENIIGYTASDNKYNVFWGSYKNKEIAAQLFDFDKKTVTDAIYKFDFSKEQIIQELSVDNNFYIVSIIKSSSVFKLYSIDIDGKIICKTIDASAITLVNSYSETVNLYKAFKEEFSPFEAPFYVQNIITETPTSLTFAAYKRKIYTNSKEIIFTFDTNFKFTQIVKISLVDFSVSKEVINQPTDGFPTKTFTNSDDPMSFQEVINSNSFLVNDRLFQIKQCLELITISIKNTDAKLVKEFQIKPNVPVSFKNTDIIQENGTFKSKRVLGTSDQFINKLYRTNPAITCFEKDNNYYATIGGVSEIRDQTNGTVVAGSVLYGMVGAIVFSILTYNPGLNNFNSYQNRKVIYISSLFDKNLNHLPGEIKPLAFDELRKFSISKSTNTGPTLFKFNKYLYYGGYDLKTKTYTFYRFAE